MRAALAAACVLMAAVAPASAGPVAAGSGHDGPLRSPRVPQHAFMAPNGRSNLHVDAFQTDANRGPGPPGRRIAVVASEHGGDCGSLNFDSAGRIVTVRVGLAGPTYKLLDPRTLEARATLTLPPRQSLGGNIFQDFAGGGYFYLDRRDRAVIPTTTRHIWVVYRGRLEHDYDLTTAVPAGDKIISVLPDWHGR
jgi:hypothetical protein